MQKSAVPDVNASPSKETEKNDLLLKSSASFWCQRIVAGEQRTPYSSRDGKYLKRIRSSEPLTLPQLIQFLLEDLKEHKYLRSLVAEGSRHQKGSSEYKAILYLLRARIYVRSGEKEQAFQDAKCSLAYSENDQTEAYHARLLLAQILHQSGDFMNAALMLVEALHFTEDSSEEHKDWLQTLFHELPTGAEIAYSGGGLKCLKEWIEFQKELQKPPILQKRPKYYWYYQWMTKRIETKCGFLPDPVMDKLLCMDANDLDTLLKSSTAIRAQAAELLWVLKNEGPEVLETYKTSELTWDEVKYIQETTEEDSEPTNLLKDHEEESGNKELPILITPPNEFIARMEQLLTEKHKSLRSLTFEQETHRD